MFLRAIGGLLTCAFLGTGLFTGIAAESYTVYVGTYTSGDSRGIYAFDLDPDSGATTEPRLVAETPNPSFLALHPNGNFLYAVNELGEFNGEPGGGITAFRITKDALVRLNARNTRGGGPCHLFLDRQGKSVLVANYGGGSVVSFRVNDDGQLGEQGSFIQHTGSGPNPRRQEAPHGHGVYLNQRNDLALVADLGLDQVLIYRFNPETAELEPNDQPFAKVPPGGGPRHLAIHPSEKHVFVLNELTSTITTFEFDSESGAMTESATISTLPDSYPGSNSTAEIYVHPNGRFVYASNRGHDSIAIFGIEPSNGTLTLLGHEPTGGKTPRGFGIDPRGQWLIAGNQGSDSVLVFQLNPESGRLKRTGVPLAVPSPICIVFSDAK